jgi:tyrosine-protein kinase Etk/Wzc
MNTPGASQNPGELEDSDDINLLALLDIVLEARWLIAAVTFVVLMLGGAYAFLVSPVIYEADSLIQVEDTKPGAAGALGDAGSLFDIRSPASAEMEILRSRLVVSQAVDELHLYISAAPQYMPLVGRWLARRATTLSDPGSFGMDGRVSGTESINVGELEVPDALLGLNLLLTATSTGYELRDPDGSILASGVVGQMTPFTLAGVPGRVMVAELKAKPGANFVLRRDSRLEVIETLQTELTIAEKGKQSGVIGISLQGQDPILLAKTLATVGTFYVKQNTDRRAAEAEKSLVFLDGFLPQLKRQLEESEGKFTNFRDKKGTFNLSSEGNALLTASVDLQTKLIELQQKRKELEALFTSEHPRIKTLDAQAAALSRELGALGGKAKALPDTEQDLLRLTRDVKVNSELYTNLLNSLQQLRLVKEGKVGNVRIVDTAAVPEVPIKPKRSQIIAISAVLGLLLGLGLAVLRNSMRPGIKDVGDIEQATGLHVFATVPRSLAQQNLYKLIHAREPGNHLLATLEPQDASIESLRSLRTALQFAMLDARNNVVLITGPTPGIGKSFTSANFAGVLGAANKRVLLIDADMRKGHLHHYFGLERGMGLSELIVGSQPLEKVLRKNVAANVDLISTGTMPPNPGELLLSHITVELIQHLSTLYDLVLIDTPPVLAVSDTQALAPSAGTVFLVARSEVSTLGELIESTKRLSRSGVQVKGVVFNDLDTARQRRYGYGYKYSSYRYTDYKYGESTGSAAKS